jgi:hypothetical protein
VWDLAGSLLNYTGSPVLLGGSATANSVADDAAVAARVGELRTPLAALTTQVVGEPERVGRGETSVVTEMREKGGRTG